MVFLLHSPDLDLHTTMSVYVYACLQGYHKYYLQNAYKIIWVLSCCWLKPPEEWFLVIKCKYPFYNLFLYILFFYRIKLSNVSKNMSIAWKYYQPFNWEDNIIPLSFMSKTWSWKYMYYLFLLLILNKN